MASTHKHLRSSTADKRPTTSIAEGQIALNTNAASPGLFFKDSTGATIIKVGPVHVGTTAPNAVPAAGGSSGNSTGEVWLDTSLTPPGVKIWDGAAWANATPAGSTTVQGLLELATNAETQAGSDAVRAVTPASLQSKVSDSTSTASSTTIASSAAVKSAYDLANAALPKAGGTVTGTVTFGTTGVLAFEGSTDDGFETAIAVVDPTADNTITLPNVSGTVVTTGDSGTVTSAMIADGTIVNADISASAEIAVSKLADGAARQLLQTDAAGTGVEWTSNVDVPGTLDVTGAATFDSIASHPLGSAGSPTITFTGDPNTGIYSPGADQLSLSTNASERLRITSAGLVGIGTSSPANNIEVVGSKVDDTDVNYGYFRGPGGTEPGIYIGGNSTTSAPAETARYGYIRSQSSAGAARALYLQTGTSTRLVIDNTGRVGIGTTSPGGTLDIKAATSTTPLIVQGPSSEFARIDSSGRLLVGTSADSGGALFQVNGNRIRVATAKTPASATDTGTAGEICWDASYIYVCTATNTWKRTALSTW